MEFKQQQQMCSANFHFEGQMDLSTCNEIAILIPRKEDHPQRIQDIVFCLRKECHFLERINECHSTYLPLHYVVLFPFGELGWHEDLIHSNGEVQLTQREYFAFRLFPRICEFFTILSRDRHATEQNRWTISK